MPPTPPPAADDDGPPGWQAHGRPVPHPRRAADSAAFFSDTGENPEVTQPSDAPLPPYMAQLFDHPGAGQQADAANPWAPPPGHGDGFYDYDEEYETERFGDPREQRAAVVDLAMALEEVATDTYLADIKMLSDGELRRHAGR